MTEQRSDAKFLFLEFLTEIIPNAKTCDNLEMIISTCIKKGGVVNVPKNLGEDKNETADKGILVASFDESVFYNDGQFDKDRLLEQDIYVEFRDDPLVETGEHLQKSVEEARMNRMSRRKCKS